jgi:hypothetical protein
MIGYDRLQSLPSVFFRGDTFGKNVNILVKQNVTIIYTLIFPFGQLHPDTPFFDRYFEFLKNVTNSTLAKTRASEDSFYTEVVLPHCDEWTLSWLQPTSPWENKSCLCIS